VGDLWHLNLNGDAWETMCNTLLSLKYGPAYQTISDNGGDYGLDGINVSEKTIFQAYGLELDNKDPLKGCKDKIHKDLSKLHENSAKIAEILGENKISRWALVLNRKIPHSDLLIYLKKKETEIKGLNLPFIDSDFQATILEPTFLEPEHLELVKKKDNRVEIEIDKIPTPDLSEIKTNKNFIEVYTKFTAIASQQEAEQLAYFEIRNYIENSIVLDEMRKKEPDFFSEIEEIRSDVEQEAAHGSLMDGTFNSYANTKQILEARLDHKIGSRLGSNILGRIKRYIIADWLVRCPLKFKDKNVAAHDPT
jgi:hypothetical protein